MKRQSFSFVAVIVFLGAALLNYDGDNADKRKRLLERTLSVKKLITSEETMIEKCNELQKQADRILVESSRVQESSEKGQAIRRLALQKKSDISAKQEQLKGRLEKMIVEYNSLVEEYNSSARNIFFGISDLPKELNKYEKPDRRL